METNIFSNIWGTVRKFGLDYDDFPTIIDNISFLLRTLTINILKTPVKRGDLIFYILTSIALLCYCYAYVFSMVWMVFFRYGRADITSSSAVLALSSCSFSCITKIVFMKIYLKEIKNTVENYLKCDSQVLTNTRFAKNLRKELRLVKRRASIIWIGLVSDGIIYVAIPLIMPGRHFTVELYLLYGLEPMFETPNYEIATFILTYCTGFAAYTMVTVAIYITVIAGYNEAQMRALSEELRNLWDDSLDFYNNVKHRITDKRYAVYIKQQITNEFIRIQLNDIIKFHTANINLLRDLNKEFQPFFAMEYIIMVFSIITDLLDGLEHTFLALPYTVVLILINSLAGQRLVDASDYFEKSLYSCQWENFNTSNQKTILLMLMMSQKTLMLSVGGVTRSDFNCLMVILKSSYSVYTTLQSTVKKHH